MSLPKPPMPSGPPLLVVDGAVHEGWLLAGRCDQCGRETAYLLDWDAVACPGCQRWLEFRCPDPGCATCQARPSRPFALLHDAPR